MQLSIGRVDSLRCNCLYSPSRDEAICFEADRVELSPAGGRFRLSAQGPLTVRVEKNYMKVKRGLAYFRPLDKKAFSLRRPAGAPGTSSGKASARSRWCENTDWLAANLKKFGCQYVQIDDGWQGVGQGNGENRDWYVTDKHKFPHGMKWLADYIRGKGFRPGIWLIPFATSDSKLFARQPNLFIRRSDGTSVYETTDPKTGKTEIDWTGRYVVDPTGPEGRRWFTDLFRMISLRLGLRLREDRRPRGLGRGLQPVSPAPGRSEAPARRRLPRRPRGHQGGHGQGSLPAELRRAVLQRR